MYGLFAYKEITALRTKHVYRLEIYKKDFSGTAMELEEFSSSPFSITLEGEGDEIYRPVIKSSLSINIIDKDQFDYTQFFTSDAFGFRVFLLRNGVRLWSGYITPDSFGQDLQYRSTINLVARDNIGYLSEIDYDWFDYDFVSIEQLLTKAFDKIQAQFSLDNRVNIFSGNKPITDAYIQTVGLKDKTWFEVLEEVLSGCGLQLRYINDNYTLHDIANEVELGGNYTPTFIDRSQRVDFSPAWREEQLEQDYLKIDNFFNMPDSGDYHFAKEVSTGYWYAKARLYYLDNFYYNSSPLDGVLVLKPSEYPLYPSDSSTLPDSTLLISDINQGKNSRAYASIVRRVKQTDRILKISINAYTGLYTLIAASSTSPTKLEEFIPFPFDPYHVSMYFNLFLESEDGRVLIAKGDRWVEYSDTDNFRIQLDLPEVADPLVSAGSHNVSNTDLTLRFKNIPENGRLIFAIYQWTASAEEDNYGKRVARIDSIKMSFEDETEDISGQESKITINESNNVKQSFDFKYGQIPDSSGGYLAFAGGLHDNDDYHTPLTDWYRSAFPGNKYNLLELVGRGLAHHGKKARKIMTGTILFDGQDFSKILVIDNEKYVINGGTYDVTKETLTGEFIEVEPYSTDDYVITGGAVSGGSSNISTGGNRDTLLWTDNAANTKRVNELGVATSDDLAGSNLLIDNPEWSEAKRISADMLDDKFYWDKSLDTTEDKSDKDSWIIRTKHSIVSDKGISAYGLGSTSGGGASGSLGELVNVGLWADEVPTADRVMVQLAGATHWSAKPLADLVGLDTAALAQYLTANSYLKASDISSYLTWANLSGKPTVYPTSWELVTGRPTKLSDLTDDVVAGNYLPKPTWDAVFEVVTVDGTPALKVKYDILGLKGITAYAEGSLSGGFSGALVDLVDVAVTNLASGDILKYNGTHFVNVPVSSIAGASSWDQITGKPEYYPTRWADVFGAPTSLPASDVYPWAKAASKPTYTAAEVGAVALNGGGDVSGSINASAYLTANTLRTKADLYPTISFVKTNDNSESLLIVAGNSLYYRPVASDATNRLVYHSGNFNPSSKLDKSVWDEAFELKTVNGVRVISAKLDFLSVAGISAYATGPSSGGGGGGLDYDLLKQALTGAITPDGYPFTISASFLGAIGNTYLPLSGGTLTNTGDSAPLIITGSSLQACTKYMMNGSTVSGYFGVVAQGLNGAFMQYANGTISPSLIINNDAAPRFINTAGTQFILYHSGNFNPDSKFPYLGMGGVNDNSNEIGAGYSGSSAGGNFNGPFIKFGQTSNYMTELYNRHDQDVFQIRRMVNGEWQAFVNLWHSGNFNPDNYLPLSGGSITGGLGVSGYLTAGVLRVKATSYPQISFVNTTTNRDSLLFVNGSELYWRPTAGTATDYKVYHSGNFNPGNYLLLSGGTMTGDITFGSNGGSLRGSDGGNIAGVLYDTPNARYVTAIGTGSRRLILVSPASIYRGAGGVAENYMIYDSGNFNPDSKFNNLENVNDSDNVVGNGYTVTETGSSFSGPFLKWGKKDYMIEFFTGNNVNDIRIRNMFNGVWGDSVKMYHSGNSNLSTVDWAAKNITAAGTVTAPTFVGALSGTATRCYGLAINNSAGESNCLQFMQTPSQNDAGDLPNSNWYHILKFNHGNGDTYYNRTLALPFYSDDIYTRRRVSGTAYSWVALFGEHNANRSDTNWTANTLTATKLVLGGITIDVYNGALRVNGNLVATGGVTSLATA